MFYSHNEILDSSRNEQTTTSCNDKDESHKHNTVWEKKEAKEHTPYDSMYTELQKQAELIDGIKI